MELALALLATLTGRHSAGGVSRARVAPAALTGNADIRRICVRESSFLLAIALYPNTPSGHARRDGQATLKPWLDQLNNGAGIIPTTPCTRTFY